MELSPLLTWGSVGQCRDEGTIQWGDLLPVQLEQI